MKIDYKKTIDGLKESGLIKDGDKYAVCLFQTESNVTTMTTSTVDYIMCANDDEIKLFVIHQKTGEYLDRFFVFRKADIAYTKKLGDRRFIWASKGLFGGMNIAIRFIPDDFAHDFIIPKKVCGYEQIEDRERLFNFVKETYNPVYDELKRQYKESK